MENKATQWRKSSYSGDQGGSCVECAPLGPITWRKSPFSGDQGGDCVECATLGALAWHKSQHSSDQGGECLEVAELPGATVAVRDSKNPVGPVLAFRPDAFRQFVSWAGAIPA
ncbi:DUF397 domain-containing protein [Streptomyces sp. NPDC006476]|uniref:DUF397 domain-containing protein n=1 Tax=Streptomyces sp. NPDC006476 TaxID=3157175 RepID=UPI0033B3F886